MDTRGEVNNVRIGSAVIVAWILTFVAYIMIFRTRVVTAAAYATLSAVTLAALAIATD